jgi:hypothetical protein
MLKVILEKELSKKDLIKKINQYNFDGSNVYYLVDNVKEYDEFRKQNFQDKIEKIINAFGVGGFVKYAYTTFEGKGLIEFCKDNGLPIVVSSIDKNVVEKESFNKINKARNLALASIILNKNPNRTILYKLYNPHQISDINEIIYFAKLIKNFLKG